MSRLCAKPTCSAVAQRWFDVSAADCEVVERSEPTPSTIALCGPHAGRFSVPNGWNWVPLQPVATPEADDTADDTVEAVEAIAAPAGSTTEISQADADDESDAAASPTRRRHTRDAPWFLANASVEPTIEAGARLELSGSDADTDGSDTDGSDTDGTCEPSAGSLLHRAFHGPDRAQDVARVESLERDSSGRREPRTSSSNSASDTDDDDVATVRDISSRRTVRTPVTAYDVELPFPPLESGQRSAEPQSAVS